MLGWLPVNFCAIAQLKTGRVVIVKFGSGHQITDAGLRRDMLARPLLSTFLENHVAPGALIAVCGEPGLGKTDALDSALEIGKRVGAHVRMIELGSMTPDMACERVGRESRALQRRIEPGEWAVVCLNGMVPLDERCVHRMLAFINRFRNNGHCVVISLRPEAVQLIEPCADANVLWAHELCVAPPSGWGPKASEEFSQLTAGLPCLAEAIYVPEKNDAIEIRAGRDYHEALSRLIALSLRESLINDERELRLAMMLLGSGTFEQLGAVLGKLDLELLQDICRHAPFFGVDMAQSSFACAGLCRDPCLASNMLVLRETCESSSHLCARIASVLLKADRVRRAGSLLAVCKGTEESASLVLCHAIELVNVGCAEVVRHALPLAMRFQCCSPQLRSACETLMKLVNNASIDESEVTIDHLATCIEEERKEMLRISLLLAARLSWQGRQIEPSAEASALNDALARDLSLHLSATNALVNARGHAAYQLLICGSQLSGKDTLMNQLLEADLALAHILMGLPCPGGWHDYLETIGESACMLCYVPILGEMDAIWRQGSKAFTLSMLDARANQVGDELMRVYMLLSAALVNARNRNISHAVVKANRALAIAKRVGATSLADISRIVCWGIRISASDLPSMKEFERHEPVHAGYKPLAQMLGLMASGICELPSHLADVALDRDVTWVLVALLDGLGRFSSQLARIIPQKWRATVESMRAHEEDEAPAYPIHRMNESLSDLPDHSVYVRLFGGLEVYVNGARLPQGAFDRRRAKALVAYACSASSRILRRADIIDAIWPECDYEQGNKRIYAATNVINRALKDVDSECRFFAARGTDHSLSLDERFVRSDVGEFESLAHQIIGSEGNDEEVLGLVRGAQGLYGGDLYTSGMNSGSAMDRRRLELRNLYADVLVAGAEAAFRSGSMRLSILLSEQALLVDELREDANSCLVDSLYSCGRSNEARDRAKQFLDRLRARGKE